MFSIVSATAQAFSHYMSVETTVYVYPEEMTVCIGETFEAHINICNVSGLQGFDFMLSYDTTLLDCVALEEGTFLSDFGPTFVAMQEIDDTYTSTRGRVWFAVAIYGTGYADGNGTLASITFKATAVGETILDLYSDNPYKEDSVKLVTCGPEPIPNIAIDGHVVVSSDSCEPPDPPADPPPDPPPNPPDSPKPDLNGDGEVDIRDITIVAKVYGISRGQSEYNQYADLDGNDIIDIRDVTIVAVNFGSVL